MSMKEVHAILGSINQYNVFFDTERFIYFTWVLVRLSVIDSKAEWIELWN
jgi:hypothetical protein